MKKIISLFMLVILGIFLININDKIYAENNLSPQFQMKWAKKYVANEEMTSAQTIAKGNLIFTAGNKLYKINKESGKIIKSVKLQDYANYNAPTVGDNKVFVAVKGGIIEAFDLDTFEKVWSYKDSNSDKYVCKIVYQNKKIYTGIYQKDGKGKYICLSTKKESVKKTLWSQDIITDNKNVIGKVINSTIIVGGKDKYIYFLDVNNGKIKNKIELKGNISSEIVYSQKKLYFSTSNGYLYSGDFDGKDTLKNIKFKNYKLGIGYTPIINKDRLYIAFASNLGGKILVADKNSLEEIYTIKLKGIPNDNMILSEGPNSDIYIYTTYRSFPGNIAIIKTNSDTDKADEVKVKDLLQLKDVYKDYCNTNIIQDDNGNMYYSNNSSYIINIHKMQEIVISFDPQNGEKIISKVVREGEILDYIPEDPIKRNCYFLGWYTDINDENTEYKNRVTYLKDTVYYAKYWSKDGDSIASNNSNGENDSNRGDNNKNNGSQSDNKSNNELDKKQKEEELKREEANKKAGILIVAVMAVTFGIGTIKFLYGK